MSSGQEDNFAWSSTVRFSGQVDEISQEPIGKPIRLDWRGGINIYLYVGGNPLTYADPLGLRVITGPGGMPIFIPVTQPGRGKGGFGGKLPGECLLTLDCPPLPPELEPYSGLECSLGNACGFGDPSSDGGPLATPEPMSATRESAKKRSTDIPDWAKGKSKNPNENCNDFASRLLDEKYGCEDPRAKKRGPGSEHNKIKKHCERG